MLGLLKHKSTATSTISGFNHAMEISPLFRSKALKLLAPSFPFLALPKTIRDRISTRIITAGHLGLLKASKVLHAEITPFLRRFAFCRITIGPYPLARPTPFLSRGVLENIMNVSISVLRVHDPNLPEINTQHINLFGNHNVIRRHCNLQIVGNPGRSWALSPQFIWSLRSLTCFTSLLLKLTCRVTIKDAACLKGWRTEWHEVSWNDLYSAATDLQYVLGSFLIKAEGALFQPWNYVLKRNIAIAIDNGLAETNPGKLFGYPPRLKGGRRGWIVSNMPAESNDKVEDGSEGWSDPQVNGPVNGPENRLGTDQAGTPAS